MLYNWHIHPVPDVPADHKNRGLPTPENIRTNTMFTNTVDEEEFYLCSSRIELKGVEALELMRMMMDDICRRYKCHSPYIRLSEANDNCHQRPTNSSSPSEEVL